MRSIFILIATLFLGCNHLQNHLSVQSNLPALTVNKTDPDLSFQNGYCYYGGKLFTGIMTDHFKNDTLHQSTEYSEGKENGWQLTFYPDGVPAEKRFYQKGEKDSVHQGWWQNGNKRFEYHFISGVYNGDYKEWYQSGKPLKHIYYTNGSDTWGKGWRENGKMYMNFIVKNGRRYGINNSNLCYTVKNGNSELVNSVPGD